MPAKIDHVQQALVEIENASFSNSKIQFQNGLFIYFSILFFSVKRQLQISSHCIGHARNDERNPKGRNDQTWHLFLTCFAY